jgi:tRNA1Val (adenine37-N6)-methyltransferase
VVSIFKLQQFSVKQTISGMKICSDSLLFGAVIPVNQATKVLDIGTGTGILSLMLAQKANADIDSKLHSVTAVELTQEAAKEAQENFGNSPWSDQLKAIQQDIQQFSQTHKDEKTDGYDLIISNPPFFVDQSKTSTDNPLRHVARHSDQLPFNDLCQSIDQLLTASGSVYLLLPLISITDLCNEASNVGLKLVEQVDIAESADHLVKVSILHFVRNTALSGREFNQQRLNKFSLPNVHSDEVRELLGPFLLRYL